MLLATALALTACGSRAPSAQVRSVAALCQSYWTQAVAFTNQLNTAAGNQDNPLPAFADLVAAPNDLAILFTKMAAVAPGDIEPDVSALATAFRSTAKSEGQAVTDPIGAIAGNLGTALGVTDSYNRVNQYLTAHCASTPPSGLTVVGPPTPPPSPAAEITADCDNGQSAFSVTPGTKLQLVFHTQGVVNAEVSIVGTAGQVLASGSAPALQATSFNITAPANGVVDLDLSSPGTLLASCSTTIDFYLSGGSLVSPPQP